MRCSGESLKIKLPQLNIQQKVRWIFTSFTMTEAVLQTNARNNLTQGQDDTAYRNQFNQLREVCPKNNGPNSTVKLPDFPRWVGPMHMFPKNTVLCWPST